MRTTRRRFVQANLLAALSAGVPAPGFATVTPETPGSVLNRRYAKLDEILRQPVVKRQLLSSPVMIETLELLRYRNSFLCRVRSRDGAEGISVGHSELNALYPIFVRKLQPFFIGKDARDLDLLLEKVFIYGFNFRFNGISLGTPLATIEFAILDLLGSVSQTGEKSFRCGWPRPKKTAPGRYLSKSRCENEDMKNEIPTGPLAGPVLPQSAPWARRLRPADPHELNLFSVWKEYEGVAMHFNDLLIRLRTQALGGVAALAALAAVIVRGDLAPQLRWTVSVCAFVLLNLLWVAVWTLDMRYYNRLLHGAVRALLELEELSRENRRLPGLVLSTRIEDTAERGIRASVVSGGGRLAIWWFYGTVSFGLLLGLVLSVVGLLGKLNQP